MGNDGPRSSLARSADEPQAFAEFYDRHAQALLANLTRRVCDGELGLELMAETFAQAYRSRRSFRGSTEAEAAAWLYRIAERQVARYYRKRCVEARALRRLGIERPQITDEERLRIEQLADMEGVRDALRAELRRLSTAQRDALELRVVDELPYAEVARRLEISEQAARARVARGLKKLAGSLDVKLLKESMP